MLVLDPTQPPLWRSPDTLQFGVEARAVLDAPTPWQQRMVTELTRGVPETALGPVALALGGTEREARALVDALAPVLCPPATTTAPRTAVVHETDHAPAGAASHVAAALSASGAAGRDAGPGQIVVLVSSHVTDPRVAAALLRDDTPHLPVVFVGGGVTIGPLVEPGRTPCLMCVAAERRDLDPAWPALAGQLLECAPVEAGAGLALEAGLVAARMVMAPVGRSGSARSVTLSAVSPRRSWRVHRQHEDCGCRSPEGTSMRHAESDPRRPATTTATAIARPA
jgi:hypothetical protein